MKTPIVFIIFNRPEETRRVFETIRRAKPETLLVIADGPRNESEKTRCDETRQIIETVDWPCVVHRRYTDENHGCRKTLTSGLVWAFDTAERAIVLEADCLPHPSFFPFCEELLDRYATDSRIMHISGNFFQQKNTRFKNKDSYYFSNLPHIWGFATWRRAWKHYDSDMQIWPTVRAAETLRQTLPNPAVYEYWETIWDQYYQGRIDSWDGQWTFACMLHEGISVTPTKNLVSNIGFGPDAIHTKDSTSMFANMPTYEMRFPLHHPATVTVDAEADAFTWKQNFGINKRVRQKILGPIRRTFPRAYGTIRSLIRKLS